MFPTLIIVAIVLTFYMGGSKLGASRKKKKRAMEIEVETLLAKKNEVNTLIAKADHDLAEKLAEIERETTAEKMAAVKGLHRWAEQEKQRLQKRFDQEYERKLEDLKKLN